MTRYRYIWIILPCILFAALSLWIKITDDRIKEQGIKAVATLSKTGGKNVDVMYMYNYKIYHVVLGHTNRTLQNGECYNVFVNKKDPQECVSDFSEPVFNKADFTTVPINSLEKLWFSNDIEFKYVIDGAEYTRFQAVPSDIKLSKNNSVLFVNKANPGIAYIVY